jgi:hypothetical protein
MFLHIAAMFLEIGIVGVTLSSLLSELKDDLSSDAHLRRHRREIMMTSMSLAFTFITFGITMLGSGDAINGLKVARTQISVAGHAVISRVSTAGSSVSSHVGPASERHD